MYKKYTTLLLIISPNVDLFSKIYSQQRYEKCYDQLYVIKKDTQ